MITVSATEFVKNFGLYKEQAQREVVAVTSHGGGRAAISSPNRNTANTSLPRPALAVPTTSANCRRKPSPPSPRPMDPRRPPERLAGLAWRCQNRNAGWWCPTRICGATKAGGKNRRTEKQAVRDCAGRQKRRRPPRKSPWPRSPTCRPPIQDIAIEIPTKVKQHLGLDSERLWVILDDLKEFVDHILAAHPRQGGEI